MHLQGYPPGSYKQKDVEENIENLLLLYNNFIENQMTSMLDPLITDISMRPSFKQKPLYNFVERFFLVFVGPGGF